ncbi:3-deoxy-D-manno-octulosonic acid transferase [Roseovarius salinarum]|uniref:3-deoxy-D-manno-octulosonic acid transferase n=1 Tax=Roseovarius salinarum TaxID=1981892 RepID=UPI001E452D88|nr:3-deoxy-D-manno-octulosonic acid transferase [Roseovarius salinarum]
MRLYAAGANLIAPLAFARHVRPRLAAHGTEPARIRERLGHATAPRPDGPLVWFHAASVGESLSVLRLIEHMGRDCPELSFLMTSGTATSAQVIAKRLPPRCSHQFAPLDSRAALRRFFDHWRPDAGVFVESELWPQMIAAARDRGVPLALVNARLSDRSLRRWRRVPRTARFLLGQFAMIHCQDARTATNLQALGIAGARAGQSLKAAAGPLPFDADAHARLAGMLGDRPVWVASSTHPGEEEVALGAHRRLLADHRSALLILVPRHPERGGTVAEMIAHAGLTVARRSTGGLPGADTQVYLADTLGETGLWYALAPLTFLGGSLTDVGGHNPYEPAQAGSAVLHGPLHANFAQAYADLHAADAGVEVADAGELGAVLHRLIAAPAQAAALRENAHAFARRQDDMLDELGRTLAHALGLVDAPGGQRTRQACPN